MKSNEYKIRLDFDTNELTLRAVCSSPRSPIDWVLMLEDVEMEMKMKFAQVIGARGKLNDAESRAVIEEIDKLQRPHPNLEKHEAMVREISSIIWDKIADKYKKHVSETGETTH